MGAEAIAQKPVERFEFRIQPMPGGVASWITVKLGNVIWERSVLGKPTPEAAERLFNTERDKFFRRDV